MKADIVLATLNARYIHTAFGLRYLLANLGPLQNRAGLLEFDLSQRPTDIVKALLDKGGMAKLLREMGNTVYTAINERGQL